MTNVNRRATTVSVVLCTYNGAEYLPYQLSSIASQTRVPDEVIVRDDMSSDSTVDILSKFAAATAIPVRLMRNRTRLGVAANFEAAIADASSDYVALCDQDDIWDATKLYELAGVLDAEPDVAGAVADARCIRADGKELRGTVWQRNRFSVVERQVMDRSREIAPLLRGNVIPGACLMFRASFRDFLLPISPYSHYDHWLALLLQSVGGLALVDETLQSYRLHSRNTVGMPSGLQGLLLVRSKNMKSAKIDAYRFTEDVLARLEEKNYLIDARSVALLQDWNEYARFRATLPEGPVIRARPVLKAAIRGSYRRHTRNANRIYSGGTVSWLYDLLLG